MNRIKPFSSGDNFYLGQVWFENKKMTCPNLYKNAFLIFCFFLTQIAKSQIMEDESSAKRLKIEAYVGGNYSFSSSTSLPLNHWAYYEFEYWPKAQVTEYHQLVNGLDTAPANWTLNPQLEIGIRLFYLKGDNFGIGFNLVFTGNSSSAVLSHETEEAKAELFFQGKEKRIIFQPLIGNKIGKYYYNLFLDLGVGFNKNYDSHRIITDQYGIKTRTSYAKDLFYNVDYSVGLGFGLKYEIMDRVNVGLTYNVYRVNTGEYKSTGILSSKFVNGFWNNSIGLSLGYNLL